MVVLLVMWYGSWVFLKVIFGSFIVVLKRMMFDLLCCNWVGVGLNLEKGVLFWMWSVLLVLFLVVIIWFENV